MTQEDSVPDICDLILDDHTWFRERFAELDGMRADGASAEHLAAAWSPLADRLEVHAVAEEELFYPRLLQVTGEDPLEETEDAITDHNSITEAVDRSRDLDAGSDDWWDAVLAARESNSSHTAEEDRGALPDFRANVPEGERLEIGGAWLAHARDTATVARDEKDPVEYTEEVAGADRAEDMQEFLDEEE